MTENINIFPTILPDTLFLEELSQVKISNNDDGFNNFLKICRNTLDKSAPRKENIRDHNALFMKKTLRF